VRVRVRVRNEWLISFSGMENSAMKLGDVAS
ncbi:MAG: hypothetical protein ACI856_002685, partial [Kiritimatiellia bacterium]